MVNERWTGIHTNSHTAIQSSDIGQTEKTISTHRLVRKPEEMERELYGVCNGIVWQRKEQNVQFWTFSLSLFLVFWLSKTPKVDLSLSLSFSLCLFCLLILQMMFLSVFTSSLPLLLYFYWPHAQGTEWTQLSTRPNWTWLLESRVDGGCKGIKQVNVLLSFYLLPCPCLFGFSWIHVQVCALVFLYVCACLSVCLSVCVCVSTNKGYEKSTKGLSYCSLNLNCVPLSPSFCLFLFLLLLLLLRRRSLSICFLFTDLSGGVASFLTRTTRCWFPFQPSQVFTRRNWQRKK